MPKKTRIILFYTFVLLFLLAGTSVLLYSSGWRIDFETGKIQKIGAIYIKANVRDITIKVNGKEYADDSGLLQSGTLISSLLPKTYRVEVTKDGFLPYHKTVTVQPARVEELLNIQLIPEKLEPTVLAQVKGTRFVDAIDSGSKMILQDTTTGTYYLYDKTNASSTVNLTLAINNVRRSQKIKRIAFIPFKPSQFIFEDATGLKLFDSEKRTIDQLLKASIVTWTIKDSTIIIVETTKTHTQQLSSFNLIFKAQTMLDDINKQLPNTTFVSAVDMAGNANTLAFTNVEDALFLRTSKKQELRTVAGNVKMFSFSPDGKKLAILKKTGELSILFIEDFDGDVRKKEGDVITTTLPQKESVEKIEWYGDSYHLLVAYPRALSLTELDDRKPLNIFSLLTNIDDYRYDSATRSLFYIAEKKLQSVKIEK